MDHKTSIQYLIIQFLPLEPSASCLRIIALKGRSKSPVICRFDSNGRTLTEHKRTPNKSGV